MSQKQLLERMICSRAKVNMQKARDGFIFEREIPLLTAVASEIMNSKLFVLDDQFYIDGLVARSRRLKARHNVDLIVIDYLQRLNARGFKADHREKEVGHISSRIKSLAKELRIPVIVLAQLNRQPEARKGGKPRLSDLRESGTIEQDSDVVGLLVRQEVYEDNADARSEKSGEAELIIAKQRNGPIGEVSLTFLKEFTRFESRAKKMNQSEFVN